MKIQFIIQQTFEIEADTLLQAHASLREVWFPITEMLLAVKDQTGNDITAKWRQLTEEIED
jgi:hypothetical protein